ncbi:hypothetical protein KW795_02180 [Candidatus Microgenomates bacterium]|nr:hypothetical protein [Candidatus Microgenomates bacterium]
MSVEHSQRPKFTPMPYAQTQRLRTAAELPFHIEEEIGLNLESLNKLMQLGGIRHLRIENDTENKKTSKVSLGISGMNNQGSAYGGVAVTQMVPPSLDTVELTGGGQLKQAKWMDLTIKLNTQEMTQRMLQADQDVRQPENWARDLQKIVKKTVVGKSLKHLLSLGPYETALFAWVYTQCITNAANLGISQVILHGYHPQNINIPQALFFLASTGTIARYMCMASQGRERSGQGMRISLFYGLEIDRAIILAIQANREKLVEKI